MLIINNRFLSLYDYNFLLVIEKIRKRNSKICGSRIPNVILFFLMVINYRTILKVNTGERESEDKKVPIQ